MFALKVYYGLAFVGTFYIVNKGTTHLSIGHRDFIKPPLRYLPIGVFSAVIPIALPLFLPFLAYKIMKEPPETRYTFEEEEEEEEDEEEESKK